ncbi:MAG: general secretion pathway protein GspK, partial [Proteobacteria bacterium]|nr:general secretion pathway protein GspK [Pseudomonadota bacterium]
TETRTEVTLARNLVENAKAKALADAGVHAAMLGLRRREVEKRWRADGTVYSMASGEGEVSIVIIDEAGKIDLNAAPDELIQGLFTAVGLEESAAQALAAAIADFRDADDETHIGGAEDAEYRAAGLPYGPKNEPFEAVEELHQVLGMTRELYALAAPGLTVHSRSRGVDVTVAPAIVLQALPGVDAEAVEAFAEQRAGQIAQGRSGVGQMAGAGGARVTTLPGLGRQYAARSRRRVFTVRAEARVRSGAVFVREAVISMTRNIEKPFSIHAWRRGRMPPRDGAGAP